VRKDVRAQVVAAADLVGGEPQLARGDVEQALHHEDAVLPPRPAHRRHRGAVGEDRAELAVVRRHVVRPQQRALAVDGHGEAVRIVRARVVEEEVAHSQDLAVRESAISASWICERSCVVAKKFSWRSSAHFTGRPSRMAAQGTSTSSG
jgi:hypothetical protein